MTQEVMWSSALVPGSRVPKPLVISLSDSADDRVLFFLINPFQPTRVYDNEGQAPSTLRMGTGCQGNQPRDQRVGTFDPPPTPTPKRGEGPRLS